MPNFSYCHRYRFQPTTSGTHTIETHDDTDTYLTLYQSDQTTIIAEDDDGGEGYSSKITESLNAGVWYYAMVRGYNSSIIGSYSIDVKSVAGKQSKKLEVTSIDEIKIYPNPFNYFIRIDNNLIDKNSEILIYDDAGRIVYRKYGKLEKIETSSLRNGIYNVFIKTSDNKISRFRMIKVN